MSRARLLWKGLVQTAFQSSRVILLNRAFVSVAQKEIKLKMGVVGLFFESHPPNLLRIHFSLCYDSAEIFERLSQTA